MGVVERAARDAGGDGKWFTVRQVAVATPGVRINEDDVAAELWRLVREGVLDMRDEDGVWFFRFASVPTTKQASGAWKKSKRAAGVIVAAWTARPPAEYVRVMDGWVTYVLRCDDGTEFLFTSCGLKVGARVSLDFTLKSLPQRTAEGGES